VADYYSLVARAVGALDPTTAEARREVYERARAALLSEIHKSMPAWDRSEIMAEQLFLELAIGEVEAELQSLQTGSRRLVAAKVAPHDAAADPKLSANQNEQRSRGSLGAELNEVTICDQRPHNPTIEESDCARHSRMTELPARASPQLDQDFQHFPPKPGSNRVDSRRLSFCDSERPDLREALALWSQGYAAYRRTSSGNVL
jgi:hypothetical protein